MAGTDYAADLLGGSGASVSAPKQTDYAAELFGGTPGGAATAVKGRESMVKKKAGPSGFDQLPLANRESMDGTADFGTLVKINMVDDPQTKVKIFAKSRFPKMAEKDAEDRVGIIDGHLVYLGEDEKLYRADPPGFAGWLKDNIAAGTLANLPAVVGGTAGAVAGAPAGPAGVLAGGALGAAAGKGYSKVAANLALDEPQTPLGNAAAMGEEALWTTGGNVVGIALGKFLQRSVAKDIAKVDPAKTADLQAKATAQGVELDPAQLTNLPSLKAKKDVLASMPTSRDIIAEGAQKQGKQAYDSVDRFLAKVSPVDGLDEAGTLARDASKKVISQLTKERADAAAPLYRQAFEEFQGIPAEFMPAVNELASRPSMKRAAKVAERLAKDEGIILSNPQNSLLGMHYMKLALGDMIDGAPVKGMGPTTQRSLIGLKDELVQMMDEFSPTYKQARETFAHFSPNITSVKEGVISRVAGLGDEQAHTAAKLMFDPTRMSPESVGRARVLFEKAGLANDWNAMLRSYLQDTFETAGKGQVGSEPLMQAPRWENALVGNPRQFRIMEKAMTPQQFSGFKDMMEVFDAMGRTAGAGSGSQTMGRQEAAAAMRRESGAGVVGNAANLMSPQNIGARVSSWLAEARMGQHAEKMAEIMTSPDAMKRLKELKKLSPRDQRFIAGASSLFGISLNPVDKPADEASE